MKMCLHCSKLHQSLNRRINSLPKELSEWKFQKISRSLGVTLGVIVATVSSLILDKAVNASIGRQRHSMLDVLSNSSRGSKMTSNFQACSINSSLANLREYLTIFLIAASFREISFSFTKAWMETSMTSLKNCLPSGFHLGMDSQMATQAPSWRPTSAETREGYFFQSALKLSLKISGQNRVTKSYLSTFLIIYMLMSSMKI